MGKTDLSCPRVWRDDYWSHTQDGIVREHLKQNRWCKVKHDNSHSREAVNVNFKIIVCVLCIVSHQCFHVCYLTWLDREEEWPCKSKKKCWGQPKSKLKFGLLKKKSRTINTICLVVCYELNVMLSFLNIVFNLHNILFQLSCLHFADEETKIHRALVTCPRSLIKTRQSKISFIPCDCLETFKILKNPRSIKQRDLSK